MQRQKRQPTLSEVSNRRDWFINYKLISSSYEIFLRHLLAITMTTIVIILAIYSTFAVYQPLYIYELISSFRSILLTMIAKKKSWGIGKTKSPVWEHTAGDM